VKIDVLQEEFEDSAGNVVTKKTYEDLRKQGLLWTRWCFANHLWHFNRGYEGRGRQNCCSGCGCTIQSLSHCFLFISWPHTQKCILLACPKTWPS